MTLSPLATLTLHQPWATLWAKGVKHAETRPAPPAGLAPHGVRPLPGLRVERGDLLAIHAAASVPRELERSLRLPERGLSGVSYRWSDRLGEYSLDGLTRGVKRALPLGALVGVTRVLDCVPIVAVSDPDIDAVFHVEHSCAIAVYTPPGADAPTKAWHKVGDTVANWTDQLQFGDYTPGRWAILGQRTVPLAPIGARGRQGVWGLRGEPAQLVRQIADRVQAP